MNQNLENLVDIYNSRPVGQTQFERRPNILRQPRFLIPCKSSTPLRPNPIQPIVENFPFFKILEPISKPIQFKTGSEKVVELLNLPDNIKQSVFESWNIDRQEYKIQIILILQRIEVNENVNKRLPYNITVSVNGHQCSLPKLNPGIVSWRNNDPIDITQQSDLRKNGSPNRLEITWLEEPHKYMGWVYLAQKLTWKDLLVELEKRPKYASDKTKVLIMESMKNDGDMLVDSLIASVQDPLSKLRMKLPARGVDCVHLQCFDAIQFLQMNEQKQTWKCPICRNKIKFENIVICDFFLKILQSKDLTAECDNVVFFKDGTWSERKNIEFSKNSRTNLDNVDDDETILKTKRFKYNPLKEVEINQVKDKSRTVLCVITLD